MTNSMANNKGGDNSMSTLNFLWEAQLINGEIINQLDGGEDTNFRRVKENFDKVVCFCLIGKEKIFIVDLIEGFVFIDDRQENLLENLSEKNNIRLIFTRRRIKDLYSKTGWEENIYYILGFQYNDFEGKNKKVIFQINNSGDWVIGE